jgi:PPOX class probable F420-dependent enzyme
MATVTPDHRPHVVPFVFALVSRSSDHLAYWAVDGKPKRTPDLRRIRNLEENPAVEFVVDDYDEDWERLWWVRCSGTARVVVGEAEHRAALQALENKYTQYRVAPPDGLIVAIDIERIQSWEGTGP